MSRHSICPVEENNEWVKKSAFLSIKDLKKLLFAVEDKNIK